VLYQSLVLAVASFTAEVFVHSSLSGGLFLAPCAPSFWSEFSVDYSDGMSSNTSTLDGLNSVFAHATKRNGVIAETEFLVSA